MAALKTARREFNEAQELENLQRVFRRLDKKGDDKVRAKRIAGSFAPALVAQLASPHAWRRLIATSSSTISSFSASNASGEMWRT
tara:strand:- start:879 stop:1133 length:255 start_codon:yes stop_codon:yes gene_type:complete